MTVGLSDVSRPQSSAATDRMSSAIPPSPEASSRTCGEKAAPVASCAAAGAADEDLVTRTTAPLRQRNTATTSAVADTAAGGTNTGSIGDAVVTSSYATITTASSTTFVCRRRRQHCRCGRCRCSFSLRQGAPPLTPDTGPCARTSPLQSVPAPGAIAADSATITAENISQ